MRPQFVIGLQFSFGADFQSRRGERRAYGADQNQGGDFIFRLWQLKAVYAFNPNLLLATFFQYDSESQDLGMNARLRWTFRPGNDLFVVWNRNWVHPLDEGPFTLAPESDQVAVKVRFAWTG